MSRIHENLGGQCPSGEVVKLNTVCYVGPADQDGIVFIFKRIPRTDQGAPPITFKEPYLEVIQPLDFEGVADHLEVVD